MINATAGFSTTSTTDIAEDEDFEEDCPLGQLPCPDEEYGCIDESQAKKE